MGKRAVDKGQLTLATRGKKDTVTRKDFYEAARTLQEKVVIGVSQARLWDESLGKHVPCCLLESTSKANNFLTHAYLSDLQVRELIQVLKEYLSAKEEQ